MHFIEFKLKSRHLYSVFAGDMGEWFQNGVAAYENTMDHSPGPKELDTG